MLPELLTDYFVLPPSVPSVLPPSVPPPSVDSWYNIDDLDTVVDDEYLEATLIAEDFAEEIGKMPDPSKLLISDKEKLAAITAAYNSLTAYQHQTGCLICLQRSAHILHFL